MVPTMSSKAALGEIEIKNIATHGEPQLYDFGLIKQYGSRLTVICNGKQHDNAPTNNPKAKDTASIIRRERTMDARPNVSR